MLTHYCWNAPGTQHFIHLSDPHCENLEKTNQNVISFFQVEPTTSWYWCQTLPLLQFQGLLTLSSEFFASFPRGTCALSVYYPYLALGGAYLPI